jgi:hypothetical protein
VTSDHDPPLTISRCARFVRSTVAVSCALGHGGRSPALDLDDFVPVVIGKFDTGQRSTYRFAHGPPDGSAAESPFDVGVDFH